MDPILEDGGRELHDGLAYRLQVYDLLRRVFLWELPVELLAELVAASKGKQEAGNRASSPEASFREYLAELQPEALPRLHHELHVEYTRLFVGPRHLPAPPYESVYLSPKRLMMQEPAAAVRAVYARNGFRVTRLDQEPDDSIGMELEFMCAMSKASLDAARAGERGRLAQLLAAQREFCELHLSQWVPQFCADIAGSTESAFWRSVAQLSEAFVRQDIVELAELERRFR